ncbi:MAG: hypothetical protein OEX13_14825, partial [Gammaproteobacteria bacterium]|nr:hypothetical protein [Gammaproteobacteria bacterium]
MSNIALNLYCMISPRVFVLTRSSPPGTISPNTIAEMRSIDDALADLSQRVLHTRRIFRSHS